MKKSLGGIGASLATLTAIQAHSAEISEQDARSYSFYRFNSLSATTGLLHTASADSGAPGTFRLSYLLSFYSGTGFLCKSAAACGVSGTTKTEDSVSRHGEDIALSATLTRFLELDLAVHSQSTSDDLYDPSVMQVLADAQLGLKVFTPRTPDRVFATGGIGQLKLLGGSGSIGPSTANVLLGALGTLDLTNRSDAAKRVPLRFNVNLGYLFDDTSSIADKTERERGRPITRFERFGLEINRVDSILVGVGGEFVHPVVQPFAEWSMDITSNRQNYHCVLSKTAPGDDCLYHTNGIAGAPSRFTLGAHFTPPVRGLSATLAFDIGTSGTSHFVAERAPEIPWNLYLGLGYAVDTAPPRPQARGNAKPAEIVRIVAPPETRIFGHVIDETTSQPISGARVTFEGQDRTGMTTKVDGSFESESLAPGDYALSVTADDYKDGTCKVTVAPSPNADRSKGATPTISRSEVQCSLKAAPSLTTLHGEVVDAESGAPVASSRVVIIDDRNRRVEVRPDDRGSFLVQNVPAVTLRIRISADGFLPAASELELKRHTESYSTLPLHRFPKKPTVTMTPKELKLRTPLTFADGGISAGNDAVLQEVAAVLLAHPEISKIELQSFVDDSGDVSSDIRNSEEQATKVRSRLVELGVEESRLTIVARGSETSLVPNSNPANRAKNRRIRFAIVQRRAAH